MTTMSCALVLDRAAIPAVAEVMRRLAEQGHAVVFPRGFEFTAKDRDLWVPVTVDGTRTGFDCGLHTVDSLADEDPDAAAQLRAVGSHLLEFGARGADSVAAVTVVMRALCELSGASGWVEEEVIPAAEMPHLLRGMAVSSVARGTAPATRSNGLPPRLSGATRTAMWIGLYIGMALIGWLLATR